MEVTDNPSNASTTIQEHTLQVDGLLSNWLKSTKSNMSTEAELDIPDLYYRMVPCIRNTATKRGRCLVLNYENFPALSNNAPLQGSQADVNSLTKTFESLGYEVLVHQDLTYNGTRFILNQGLIGKYFGWNYIGNQKVVDLFIYKYTEEENRQIWEILQLRMKSETKLQTRNGSVRVWITKDKILSKVIIFFAQ